ncbi:unnamed protein product [Caenorhabditis auriculariae]|uniref:CRAL-TRIO domain-containing protein n=1 Tax=Caenorhabditis auriculariae TaxID=2777116 RepID=A0A8S1HIY3_9PELO|nr:unnamed protein product [Caenorhabditis auriculariae]
MAPNAPNEIKTTTPTSDEAISEVRAQVSDLIDRRYDTKWNILRWLQGNEYNVSKTVHQLRKHLKWRKERKLDEPESQSLLQLSKIRQEYAPLCILGRNRKKWRSIVGFGSSWQNRREDFENIQRHLMQMEEELGVQCYMDYIFDLDGLSFDPTLLGVVNGPFRVSWQLVGQHYREFIDKFIVVNSPSYINVLWSAISQFVPEQSKARIVFAGASWKEELLEICDADCLPEKLGGTIPDNEVVKEVKPVPKELYWKPPTGYPTLETMHKISISASKHRTLIYKLDANTEVLLYNHNENDITFTVYFSQKENAKDEELEVAIPAIPKCGLPAIDCFDYVAEQTGYYYIRLANEASWLFPSTYRFFVVERSSGQEIQAINQKEKWIKQAFKTKK